MSVHCLYFSDIHVHVLYKVYIMSVHCLASVTYVYIYILYIAYILKKIVYCINFHLLFYGFEVASYGHSTLVSGCSLTPNSFGLLI